MQRDREIIQIESSQQSLDKSNFPVINALRGSHYFNSSYPPYSTLLISNASGVVLLVSVSYLATILAGVVGGPAGTGAALAVIDTITTLIALGEEFLGFDDIDLYVNIYSTLTQIWIPNILNNELGALSGVPTVPSIKIYIEASYAVW
ncbi:hypothetical protein MsAm2_15060 [Methanolapillus ohkumae]|uniref:Uncharacterized protein n=2 Tax=Methanolapillus ohkumae TaxID=3028298 RepID=A0AA96V8E2_9EURY|nr:hypothetical protein MsAm2_15060 [Methanosarcinaceae archaeon Am2]